MTTLFNTAVAAAHKSNPLAKFSIRCGKQAILCKTLAECREAFIAYRDDNDMGSRDMGAHDGKISLNGRKVARISYNGRVWDNEDKEI